MQIFAIMKRWKDRKRLLANDSLEYISQLFANFHRIQSSLNPVKSDKTTRPQALPTYIYVVTYSPTEVEIRLVSVSLVYYEKCTLNVQTQLVLLRLVVTTHELVRPRHNNIDPCKMEKHWNEI